MWSGTYVELGEVHQKRVTDGCELGGDDGQHGHVDAVKLVKASP